MKFTLCSGCGQSITGSHACTGFFVQPATAPATGTVTASPATWSTFPVPSLVLCQCGASYRYGEQHTCFGPGPVKSILPEVLALESFNRNVQRIADALERLVEGLAK